MKLLLDMQGAQGESRHRGIGRYTRSLSLAFARLAADRHELGFAFNSQLDEATDDLIAGLGTFADRRLLYPSLGGIDERSGDNQHRRQAARRLTRFALDQQRVDLVWYSSVFEGYVDDSVLPDAPLRQTASVATLYDLIPLHEPETHLNHPRVRQWYEGRLTALKRCDLLLAISDWVRQDAIVRLGMPEDRIVTIGAGVDQRFAKPDSNPALEAAFRARYRIEKPYVLYNGGFDPRKNVARLIAAFGGLPEDLRRSHQLVIVGMLTDDQSTSLRNAAKRARLPLDSLVFTGFVPDDDLVSLYAGCALFVFPSSQEGFGLPPLEAMACGAPVIGSNVTSLPEVIGDSRAMFDPSRTDTITERMLEVLRQPSLANALREHAARQSRQFSWQAVAERALAGIESHIGVTRGTTAQPSLHTELPRLTCVITAATPPAWLPDLNSGYHLNVLQMPIVEGRLALPPGHEWLRADRILYVIEEGQEACVADALRLWPGACLIASAAVPPTPISLTMAERYALHGYADLLALADDQCDRLLLLARSSLGLMVSASAAELLGDVQERGIIVASLPGSAKACIAQLESWYAEQPLAQELQLLGDLAGIVGDGSDADALAEVGNAVVASRRAPAHAQWLVDVSQIAHTDLGTGVQRMVRSILREWLSCPPEGVRIEPVAFVDGRYRYARTYALSLLKLPADHLIDDWVEVGAHDRFIGLDWTADSLAAAEPQLRQWRRLGVAMHFVINDLLPMTLPDAFHPHSQQVFADWLRRIGSIADHLHCISRNTADEVQRWMATAALDFQFGHPPSIDHFLLGVDIDSADVRQASPPAELSQAIANRPSLLMVGTLEPRKGHTQALDAIEQLWREGRDLNLLIVGHRGWLVEALIARLERHPERNLRLFWLDEADDALLETLYRQASALFAASWGEGYGLPLIEAAQRGLPVIARDLPIFREVMGDYACYFNANSPAELAGFLEDWLSARPAPPSMPPWPTWRESAASLAQAVRAGSARDP